jgi:(R,R)-butanediol dehydrogenase/meso-butanediol dehydrogenase/diacetyl reductase
MRADPGESIQAATGDGADIAIECSGSGPALEACIAAVRPGGVIVQTGLHSKALEFNPRTLTLRNISLLGVNCFPVTSWPKVIRLMASGRLPAERIVTGRVDVSDAVVAFDGLLDPAGDGVKVLVAAT